MNFKYFLKAGWYKYNDFTRQIRIFIFWWIISCQLVSRSCNCQLILSTLLEYWSKRWWHGYVSTTYFSHIYLNYDFNCLHIHHVIMNCSQYYKISFFVGCWIMTKFSYNNLNIALLPDNSFKGCLTKYHS